MKAPTASKSAKAWFEQGKDKFKSGDLEGALDAYRTSLKANPRVAAAWVGLAEVLGRNQQHLEALECLKRGAAAEPANPVVLLRLARSLHSLGRINAAQQAYERALSIKPDLVSASLGLAELLEDRGDAATAAAVYRKVLFAKPGHAQALSQIVGLGGEVDVSAEMAAAQLAMADASDRNAALIGYGLGKALDRMGEHDAAFAAYDTANAARRRTAGGFGREAFDARVDSHIEIFKPSFFADRQHWGDASERPAFIVGLPRSGTTLTEQILGAHPQCYAAGELDVLTDMATGTPDRLGRPDPPWPYTAPELRLIHTRAIARDHLTRLAALAPRDALRVIDKQPLNFWHLGLVGLVFPQAKIIHCSRNIRDVGLSIYAQNFNPQQRWATDLADIAHYWRGYRRLMAHWQAATDLDILDVVYEDTIADLEGQSRRLLEFLGLPWDERVLEFHQQDRAVQTPSRWQVRQPLYTSSKAKWKRYEQHLGPLIEAAER
ncbi:MAG: sulfotransferase [Pseudomonadota bacterium]